MRTKMTVLAVALSVMAAGCGGDDTTPAYDECYDALVSRYGEDGVVDVDNVTETESGRLVKVEGALSYREQQGLGGRVDTSFTCQLNKRGGGLSVRELTVKD